MFTQTDPIGIAGGLNTYGYANGDPMNFTDPFGLCLDDDDPRCLSAEMRKALGNVCGRVSCDEVRIRVVSDPTRDFMSRHDPVQLSPLDGMVAASGRALTAGNTITFPRELDLSNPRDVGWLAHEMMHVYQYQLLTNAFAAQGAAAYYVLGAADNVRLAFGDNSVYLNGFLEGPGQSVHLCFQTGGTACSGSPFRPSSR